MEGDNQQIPGFGFDPGFEPKPLPPVPTPSSSSIFGLISKVNQGILKEPQSAFSAGNEVQTNPALQQAKAIAQKLSDISPQLAKQKAFQTAKATIENIQRGIWNPPGFEKNKQGSSNTDFKVPVVKPAPKQGILSNKGQIQSTSVTQCSNYAVTTSRPQTNTAQALGTGRSLVAYNDGSKQSNNFTRQEALNEIDQYRGEVARPYDRDHTYEETTKKAEPFKSDFDRYYFGNETQRSEIADKLHRNDRQGDYDAKKGYTAYSPIGHPELDTGHMHTDGTYPRNDKPSNSRMTERHDSDYHQMFQNKSCSKLDSENYTRPVIPDSSNFPKPGNGNDFYDRVGRESFQRRSLSAESLTRDYTLQMEGKPGKANFVQKERETTSSESAGYYSSSSDLRPTYSGWGHEKQTDEKSMISTGTYLNKNKARNTGSEHNSDSPDSWAKSDRHETYHNERRASSAIDKSSMTHSKNIEGSNRRGGLVSDTKEKYNDNHEFKHYVGARNEERNRGRDSFYDGRLDWYRSRDHRGNDNDRYYDRKRDDRYNNQTDDFDDYMANMEEISDESDLDDSSQGRKIMYEDFLFGEDEEKSDRMFKSESSDKKYNYGRRKEEHTEKRLGDKKDSFIENDRNGSRRRNEVQRLAQSGERRRDIVRRMEGQRPGTDGRYLHVPMTDDQKAQVEKPGSADRGFFSQAVPPATNVGMTTGIASTSLSQQHGGPVPTGISTLPLQVRPLQPSLSTLTPMSRLPAVLQTSFPAPLVVPRPAGGLPSSLPAPAAILPPSSIIQPSIRASVAIPQPTGVLMSSAQVSASTAIPQPVGVLPPPLLSSTAIPPPTTAIPPPSTAIPPPGVICKDCDVTCMDEDVYNAHLKSDAHLLNLQRRAQELFHMEKRLSRFDVDSAGNPLKAPILPPTTMITAYRVMPNVGQAYNHSTKTLTAPGVPSSTLSSSMPVVGIGRNVFAGNVSPVRDGKKDSRQESPQRRSKSDQGVQVIPPKPLGPLETRSVHGTWLVLSWRCRHEDEEALIDKYVVEYRNAREIRWVRVGATIKHEFEVNGLQEGTDYLFRVYTTNRDEKSEYLESVLVTTKKRRDSREREKRISTRERLRERAERFRRERERRSVRDRNQKSIKVSDRKKTSGESKRKGERKQSQDHDRKTSRDSKRESRLSGQKKDSEGSKSVKKQTKDDKEKPETKTGVSEREEKPETKTGVSEGEEKHKEDSNDGVEKTDVKSATVEVDKPEETKQEEVECLLYREFPHYQNEPMLGLDNIYEIRSYMPKTPPRYVCKLCNNKGSHKIIVKHIIGFPHKLNYFKKYNAEIYDIINMIAWKKQQVERANYEARLEEDRHGRGAVRVTLMLNPQDNNGKTVYTDPVPVKAPPPARQKETGEAPEAYDGDYQSQFEAIYNEAIENGTLTDSTLIGMDYIKEILHPKMEKEPKYTCSMCSVLCYDTTILSHLVGKKHRFNYLKVYHEEAYNEIMNTKENRHQLLIDKIIEFAEKDGPGTIKTKVAKNGRMWRDKVSKAEEAQAEKETEGKEEEKGNIDEAQQTEAEQGAKESRSGAGIQAIKFDIKKNEPQQTNVKPINVLEQEQAVPKHKEAFDWNKENSLLQSRIHNETTIRSSRKSRFLTVYSEFFKKYPVIGMQWVTEFQKQDVKQEPWYMCFMCQQKLQWKSILDHVTSNLHRLNYMKKSDYRQKYNAVYHAIRKDKQSARPLIEQYSKEISDIEGPPTELEVMVELNVNTEAFKSVAKVQENMKAHASAVTSSQSIQINIISTTVSDTPSTESVSSVVQASSGQQPVTTQLLSEQTLSQNMPLGMPVGSVAPQYQEQSTMQFQSQAAAQSQVQPPPLRAPPLRPPLLRPPPSLVPNTVFPPPSAHLTQANRLPTASNQHSTVPNPRITNAPVRLGTVGTMTPSTSNVSAVPGQLQMMSGPHNPSSINTMQSVMSVPLYRPPPLLQAPQMGQVFPPRPLALPTSVQQPLLQGPPHTAPRLAGIQPTTSIAPVMSAPGPSPSSLYMQSSLNLIGHKPPPWQRQPPSIQHESVMSSYHQQPVPHMMIDQSLNTVNVDDVPLLNTSPLRPTNDTYISGPETIGSSSQVGGDSNPNNDRRDKDQIKPPWVKYDQSFEGYQERPERFQDTDRNNSKRVEEAERGIKRFGRQAEHEDINKRLRTETHVGSLNYEMKDESSQKISSNKRISQCYGDRREIDQRRSDSRDRNQGRRNRRDSREESRDKTGGNTRDTDKIREETRVRDQRRFDDRGKGQESISNRDRGLQRGGSRERNQRPSDRDRGLPISSSIEKDVERFNIEDRNQRSVDSRNRGQSNGISRERDRRRGELDPRRDSGERSQRRGNSDERAQRRGGSGERGQRRGNSDERGPRKVDDKARTQRSLNSRDRQQKNRDSRERQRSRSPLRSARRSPVHTRLRDDPSLNGDDKYGRMSEHSPSPRRNILDRSRKSNIHYLDTQEKACHSDEQTPIEGYNSPLDEAKVDDLVRLYVDREDDDYENFMAYEGEYDDTFDMRQGANRKDVSVYGRRNENYYNERGDQRTEFARRNQHDKRDVNDYRYERDTRSRSENITVDKYIEGGGDEYIDDNTDRYNEFSETDYSMNQGFRDKAGVNRVYAFDNRGSMQFEKRKIDNYNTHNQCNKDGEHLETDYRNMEGWQSGFTQERRGWQEEVGNNRDDRQSYGRDDIHMTETTNNRRDYVTDLETDRQRDRYGNRRFFDDGNEQDDHIPDPSREEIDELLRRAANTLVTPHNEFSEYDEKMPAENISHQGSVASYQRGGKGNHGYRGYGPRTGR